MMRPWLIAWLLFACVAPTAAAPQPRVDPQASFGATVRARAIRPGELLVFDIDGPRPLTDVRVHLFERSAMAFIANDALTPLDRPSAALPNRGEWLALVGVDLDQRPGAYVAEVEALHGSVPVRASVSLTVVPRRFPTRTLRVAPDFVNPSAAVLARIQQEQAFIRDAYANGTSAARWSGAFVRPVSDPANSRFGTRSVFNGEPRSPHAGTDFLSPSGTPVRAPNAGRIVAARSLFFTGNTVIIDHGLQVFSMLAHLSRLDVEEGDEVEAGHIVGLVGATGRVTGAHLHWALSVGGARVDPLSLLALLGAPALR